MKPKKIPREKHLEEFMRIRDELVQNYATYSPKERRILNEIMETHAQIFISEGGDPLKVTFFLFEQGDTKQGMRLMKKLQQNALCIN